MLRDFSQSGSSRFLSTTSKKGDSSTELIPADGNKRKICSIFSKILPPNKVLCCSFQHKYMVYSL
ncbi:hypothetical protein KFK09_017567 [Dendrobium nobile]|uniref:Uncharacterized protein n=1 Tax=Dendrobium nobile TaxID=94219 RepID=A0A8T3B3U1_DENNO|nr:hypothetical protein KFK09_017567 [Dendrobium nobile]